MPPKNSSEAEDVLDFINSLPDTKSDKNDSKDSAADGKSSNNEDFLEFLDELASNDKPKQTGNHTSKAKFEPKKKHDIDAEEKADKVKADASKGRGEGEGEGAVAETETGAEAVERNALAELDINPIESISSWWTNEGSSKVTSLWGSITNNAHQLESFLGDEEAQNKQMTNLSKRLNSIISNVSHQIGLMDDDDELLNILLVHDLYNLGYLEKICYDKFNKVMSQVEGGIKVSVNNFIHKKENPIRPDLNVFYGKIIDGEKLCFANLESSIKEYMKITKEDVVEPAREEAEKKEDEGETKEKDSDEKERRNVNKSNIFISIQTITSSLDDSKSETRDSDAPIMIEANNVDSFSFTIILKDVTNNITIITKTQPFPLKWTRWLKGDVKEFNGFDDIDPAEWVKEWIKNGLDLAFAVLSQEYVTKRMGF